jgi:hypothetical protein
MATTDPARIRELLLANLFEVFNVRDPLRRMEAIERNYTEDVTWSDPDGTTEGHEAMNEQAQKLVERMPDLVFSAAGPVYISRDLGLRAFQPGPCRSSRRRSAASTWGWCATDGSPSCTRS